MKMDCCKLIELVKERRSLWDLEDEGYRSRDVARDLWNEIATELGRSSIAAKTKWQYLRDTYRREIVKVDSDHGGTSKWRYYDLMNFLYDSYKPRRVAGSTSRLDNQSDCEYNPDAEESHRISDSDDDVDLMKDEQPRRKCRKLDNSSITIDSFGPQTSSTAPERRPQGLRNHSGILLPKKFNSVVGATKKKMDAISASSEYYFLMSLLPYLRAMPNNVKLQTQIKLQQLVLENLSSYKNTPDGDMDASPNSEERNYKNCDEIAEISIKEEPDQLHDKDSTV